jgi:alkanesulfonate monooxygenase SsuD/methylene tetrahydromethanopterin reductase-like flavin-dependent oxidoreductase (luciferase family)
MAQPRSGIREVKFGFYTPNFDFCGEARVLAGLAHDAELAGWDGFFIWDHLQFGEPTADPWVALTAMAMRTESIELGPLVTPVPRRHIAKLAREVITLDQLSEGRIVLGVGSGYPALPDYTAFGDRGDARERAAKLDEGLEVLDALWRGAPVNHQGTYYQIDCDAFQTTYRRPRVPVWVAATWPAKKPLARAARWDGVVATAEFGLEVKPDDLREITSYLREKRGAERPFDVVTFGQTRDPADTEAVVASAEAGATWWMEYIYTATTTLDATRDRIRRGPPRP